MPARCASQAPTWRSASRRTEVEGFGSISSAEAACRHVPFASNEYCIAINVGLVRRSRRTPRIVCTSPTSCDTGCPLSCRLNVFRSSHQPRCDVGVKGRLAEMQGDDFFGYTIAGWASKQEATCYAPRLHAAVKIERVMIRTLHGIMAGNLCGPKRTDNRYES